MVIRAKRLIDPKEQRIGIRVRRRKQITQQLFLIRGKHFPFAQDPSALCLIDALLRQGLYQHRGAA